MLSLKTCLTNIANWIKGVDDYIIERGVSGIWNYERYKSGIVKCYGVTSETSSGTLTRSNSIYYSGHVTLAAIPSFVDTIKYLSGNLTEAHSVAWMSGLGYYNSDIICVVDREQSATFRFQVYLELIGTWGGQLINLLTQFRKEVVVC